MENTKDSIIYQALTLFSEKGYEGVSMRDIAGAVGIRAASLYNHFRSKEDIFDSIIREMSTRYEAAIMDMRIPHGEPEDVAKACLRVSEDQLAAIAKKIFLYFLKDDFASKFRRMLTMEQFRSTKAGEVFQTFFVDGAVGFEAALFGRMIGEGGFLPHDPYVMALQFYSPLFLLLNKYDRLHSREEEALEIVGCHVKQFSAVYTGREAVRR